MRLKNLFASLFFVFAVLFASIPADAAVVSQGKSFVVTEASPSTIYTAPANGTFVITGIVISGGKHASDNTVVTVYAPVNDPATSAPIFAAAAIPGTGGGLNSSIAGLTQLQVPPGGSITYDTINAPLFRLTIVGVEYIDNGL